MSVTIFFQVTRENIFKLYQGRLRLDTRRNVLLKGLSGIATLPREVVECPSLEIFKDMYMWPEGYGSVVNLAVLQ